MKKRIIGLVLALIMCLSICSVPAFAAGTFDAGSSIAAILEDGSLLELGNRTEKIMDDAVSVSASAWGVYAVILSDGSLWTKGSGSMRGSNKNGILGNGTTIEVDNTSAPVKIMDNAASVSVSDGHMLAVKKDGSLWAWGSNEYGQLGNGQKTDNWQIPTATPVKIMDGVKSACAGNYFSAAIKTDGSLWLWGSNEWGQIGDGAGGPGWPNPSSIFPEITGKDRLTPVKIMDGVVSVALGEYHTVAVKTDGSVWTWGSNQKGQLGYGQYHSDDPGKAMDGGVVFVAAGYDHTLAVKNDGSLWAWGSNSFSCLGDGTSVMKVVATKVLDGYAAVSARGSYSAGIKTDGTLWSWGRSGTASPVKIYEGVKMPSVGTTTPATPQTPAPQTPSSNNAAPTASLVSINGAAKDFEAYNIGGSNYFKLRDIAMALNNSAKQFAVGYDNATQAITITSGQPYTPAGGELAKGDGTAKNAAPTASKIYLDGKELNLTVYNIGGNNFFKLRDVMQSLDVYVGYDAATQAITVDTNRGYVSE